MNEDLHLVLLIGLAIWAAILAYRWHRADRDED